MKLKIKRLRPDAVIPHYATDGAAGLDLTCVDGDTWEEGFTGRWVTKYRTGLALEIPKGFVGLLFPRSSVTKTGATMGNSVGVIDSDYRGEVSAVFYHNYCDAPYRLGERCCQLVIVPLPEVEIEEVDVLSETVRGAGGFGSTGK